MSSAIHSPSTASSISSIPSCSSSSLDLDVGGGRHRSTSSASSTSSTSLLASNAASSDTFYPSTLAAPFTAAAAAAADPLTDLEAQQRHHLQQFFYFQSLALQRQKQQQQQQQQDAAANNDNVSGGLDTAFVFPAQQQQPEQHVDPNATAADELVGGDFFTGLVDQALEEQSSSHDLLAVPGASRDHHFLNVGSSVPSLSLSPSPSSQSAESPPPHLHLGNVVVQQHDDDEFDEFTLQDTSSSCWDAADATIAEIERALMAQQDLSSLLEYNMIGAGAYVNKPAQQQQQQEIAAQFAATAAAQTQQQLHKTTTLGAVGVPVAIEAAAAAPSSSAAALISAMALSATQGHRTASSYDEQHDTMAATLLSMPEPHAYQGGRAATPSWHQHPVRHAPYSYRGATPTTSRNSSSIDFGALVASAPAAPSAPLASLAPHVLSAASSSSSMPPMADRLSIRAAARQSFSGLSSSDPAPTFYSSPVVACAAKPSSTMVSSLPTPPPTQAPTSQAVSPAASFSPPRPVDDDSHSMTSSSSVRNPHGGGRGYVPGETPDDPKKKHKCDVCGRGFARLFNLKSHSLTHDPARPKPYDCPHQGCKRSFSRLHDLERHQQGIHAEGPLMIAKEHGITPALARAQERIAKRVRRGEIKLNIE